MMLILEISSILDSKLFFILCYLISFNKLIISFFVIGIGLLSKCFLSSKINLLARLRSKFNEIFFKFNFFTILSIRF